MLIFRKAWGSFLPNRGGIIFQVGTVPFNLGFPFHRNNHCFAAGSLKRSWKRLGRGMCAGRYDCTPTQCYRLDTVLSNIWRKSFCSIFDCLLGCEAAVGRLTTWCEQLWSTLWGLNYSFRMVTCIQLAWDCGEDFASYSLPDSLF